MSRENVILVAGVRFERINELAGVTAHDSEWRRITFNRLSCLLSYAYTVGGAAFGVYVVHMQAYKVIRIRFITLAPKYPKPVHDNIAVSHSVTFIMEGSVDYFVAAGKIKNVCKKCLRGVRRQRQKRQGPSPPHALPEQTKPNAPRQGPGAYARQPIARAMKDKTTAKMIPLSVSMLCTPVSMSDNRTAAG